AACYGMDLGEELGFQIVRDHFNPRCEPPWAEADLRRKCREAMDPNFSKPRGWLRDAESPNRPQPPRRPSSDNPVVATAAAAPSPGPPPPDPPPPADQVGQGGGLPPAAVPTRPRGLPSIVQQPAQLRDV